MKQIHGLYAICDTIFCPEKTHTQLAEELLSGGIKILQLRMKGETDLQRVRDTAKQILQLKKRFDFTFIVNDFVDIAMELGADGIHVGRDDTSVAEILKKTDGKVLVGYSSHGLEEAVAAEQQGAHYVALGAIFPTPTKGPGHPVLGLELLRRVVRQLKVPVVAIGGINQINFTEVLNTGVAAIAMIGALTTGNNVSQQAAEFIKRFSRSEPRPRV
jgi:thiamine-phosphate pyrophosphorylase